MVSTYRPIVDQRYIHHRSKYAIFDLVLAKVFLYLLEKMVV